MQEVTEGRIDTERKSMVPFFCYDVQTKEVTHMIKNIFFDMDGTLLPMDTDKFTKLYFQAICKVGAAQGVSGEKLMRSIWTGTEAMVKNTGERSNEEVFWGCFESIIGEGASAMKPVFDKFYEEGFAEAKGGTWVNPKVREALDKIHALGLRTVLATNPIFPMTAQKQRITWAGGCADEFEWVTAYENSHFCKPNPAYYQEILDRLGMKAEETLMVGNDAVEDTAAAKLGMKVFLITDCLLHGTMDDIKEIHHGSFDDLMVYIDKMDE